MDVMYFQVTDGLISGHCDAYGKVHTPVLISTTTYQKESYQSVWWAIIYSEDR